MWRRFKKSVYKKKIAIKSKNSSLEKIAKKMILKNQLTVTSKLFHLTNFNLNIPAS